MASPRPLSRPPLLPPQLCCEMDHLRHVGYRRSRSLLVWLDGCVLHFFGLDASLCYPISYACLDSFQSTVLILFHQVSSSSKRRRVLAVAAISFCLAVIAAVALSGGFPSSTGRTGRITIELSDRNEFESQPAWWALTFVAPLGFR